jgi:hypothetical protein
VVEFGIRTERCHQLNNGSLFENRSSNFWRKLAKGEGCCRNIAVFGGRKRKFAFDDRGAGEVGNFHIAVEESAVELGCNTFDFCGLYLRFRNVAAQDLRTTDAGKLNGNAKES